jgi:Predicted DNA alkylation repair enzyme
MNLKDIREELIKLEDKNYKEFNKKLCPDTQKPMLGVRVPELRRLARTILETIGIEEFLKIAGNDYFEEIILEGFIIAYSKISLEEKLNLIKKFIPKIDSWGICDTFVSTLKIKEKDLEKVWEFIISYTESENEFEVRFAVVMMLDYYIVDKYVDKVIKVLDRIKHDGYYVKMGIAWAISLVGIKFNDKAIQYLKNNNLDKFTYNKALQKLIESYRITSEQKEMFKKMKV